MSTTTTVNGWSIPELQDAANITQVATLASAIDLRVNPIFSTVSARNAAIVSPTEGQEAYVTATGEKYVYNGTAWVGMRPRVKYCTADQTVTDNDSVLVDSTYLQFSVEANSVYEMNGSLRWLNSTFGNDVRFGMVTPAGCTGSWNVTHPTVGDTFTTNPALSWVGSHTYGGNASNSQRGPINGLLVTAGTAGTLKLQFCEATNTGGVSNVKLCFDSVIKLIKVG